MDMKELEAVEEEQKRFTGFTNIIEGERDVKRFFSMDNPEKQDLWIKRFKENLGVIVR